MERMKLTVDKSMGEQVIIQLRGFLDDYTGQGKTAIGIFSHGTDVSFVFRLKSDLRRLLKKIIDSIGVIYCITSFKIKNRG